MFIVCLSGKKSNTVFGCNVDKWIYSLKPGHTTVQAQKFALVRFGRPTKPLIIGKPYNFNAFTTILAFYVGFTAIIFTTIQYPNFTRKTTFWTIFLYSIDQALMITFDIIAILFTIRFIYWCLGGKFKNSTIISILNRILVLNAFVFFIYTSLFQLKFKIDFNNNSH